MLLKYLLVHSRTSVFREVICPAAAVRLTKSSLRVPLRRYHGASAAKMVVENGSGRTADAVTMIDLRSDTVTQPSEAMRRAMAEATVGDDVFGEDPTVNELERTAADMMGFEASILVPSGTMANLIAILVHCSRGSEIIIGDKCHIHLYEQGGSATLGGVHSRTVSNNSDGTIDIQALRAAIRPDDVHFPVTRLICLENTHNYCGGKVLPIAYLDEVAALSAEVGIPLHMDGARLANAAVSCGLPLSRILRGFASSTLCFSKSLGAPVGSVLAGSSQFIHTARRLRKALGGGMRQAGVIASPALIGLRSMDKLAQDNKHAKILAQAVNSADCWGVSVDLANLHTNIMLIQLDPAVIQPQDFCRRLETTSDKELEALGESVSIKSYPMSATNVRLVLHCDISETDVGKAARKLAYVATELKHSTQRSSKNED